MTIPKEIRDKLYSLSQRTVANGFTKEEADSAVQMILKINKRYLVPDQSSKREDVYRAKSTNIKYNIDWNKIATEYLSPERYKQYRLTNTFTYDLIDKISWDLVAANYLHYRDYYVFWDNTERKWKERQGSTNKSKSEKEYRIYCYETFVKLIS